MSLVTALDDLCIFESASVSRSLPRAHACHPRRCVAAPNTTGASPTLVPIHAGHAECQCVRPGRFQPKFQSPRAASDADGRGLSGCRGPSARAGDGRPHPSSVLCLMGMHEKQRNSLSRRRAVLKLHCGNSHLQHGNSHGCPLGYYLPSLRLPSVREALILV